MRNPFEVWIYSVVWSSCCLVVLLIARSPKTASARFFTLHFSLFTFHSSLKKKPLPLILKSIEDIDIDFSSYSPHSAVRR